MFVIQLIRIPALNNVDCDVCVFVLGQFSFLISQLEFKGIIIIIIITYQRVKLEALLSIIDNLVLLLVLKLESERSAYFFIPYITKFLFIHPMNYFLKYTIYVCDSDLVWPMRLMIND